MATTKINFYERYAVEHMEIDMDDKGLFCKVCSERHENVSYTVRVDESQLVPVATSCNCPATKPCKHIHLVNAFYARIYKSNVEKAEAKAAQVEVVEAPVERAQAYDKDLCCMIYLDTREIVDPIAHAAAIKAQSEKITDISTKGNLNGQQGFSVLRKVG